MRLIIFLGPPGVGKGTQCALLSARLGYKHISTGAIIRSEIASKSDLGVRVKKIVESGNLVDDKIIFMCLNSALDKLDCHSSETILLDGLPRNLSQANDLELLIHERSFSNIHVISFESNKDQLIERFRTRYTCSSCSNVESISKINDLDIYLKEHQCLSCKSVGTMVRRLDDEVSVVQHRLDLYQKETLPLLSFYGEKKIISFVDGLLPPEIVYVRVASCLI